MEELKAKVIRIIAEHMGLEKSKISLSSDFVEDLGVDSLDAVDCYNGNRGKSRSFMLTP